MSYDELKTLSSDELTSRLVEMDLQLMQKHKENQYANNSWMDTNSNQDKKIDIVGLCVIGICMYNRLSNYNIRSTEFINYVIENLEMFLEHGNIPSFMQEYYIDVLNRGNVDYLNNFILKHGYDNEEGRGKGIGAYTKSTAVGRAFSEKDNMAFASVLVLPALLALAYISLVVIYFVFFYNGG